MIEIVQWIMVGLMVAASAWYLFKRLTATNSGGACSCCSKCPHGAEFAEKCAEASRSLCEGKCDPPA